MYISKTFVLATFFSIAAGWPNWFKKKEKSVSVSNPPVTRLQQRCKLLGCRLSAGTLAGGGYCFYCTKAYDPCDIAASLISVDENESVIIRVDGNKLGVSQGSNGEFSFYYNPLRATGKLNEQSKRCRAVEFHSADHFVIPLNYILAYIHVPDNEPSSAIHLELSSRFAASPSFDRTSPEFEWTPGALIDPVFEKSQKKKFPNKAAMHKLQFGFVKGRYIQPEAIFDKYKPDFGAVCPKFDGNKSSMKAYDLFSITREDLNLRFSLEDNIYTLRNRVCLIATCTADDGERRKRLSPTRDISSADIISGITELQETIIELNKSNRLKAQELWKSERKIIADAVIKSLKDHIISSEQLTLQEKDYKLLGITQSCFTKAEAFCKAFSPITPSTGNSPNIMNRPFALEQYLIGNKMPDSPNTPGIIQPFNNFSPLPEGIL